MSYGSFETSRRHESLGGNVDFDAVSIPGSIIERYRRGQVNGDLEHFAKHGDSETISLVAFTSIPIKHSWQKWLIGPFCFLYMAAYITSYYTFAQYFYAKIQNDLYRNVNFTDGNDSCSVDTNTTEYKQQLDVQERSSQWSTYYSLASGIPGILANVILGSSTDKFGRKFLFFLPCIGTLIRMLISVAGIYANFHLAFHIIGYVIEGMTGQIFTLFLVSFTYVADITPDKGKMRSFGIVMIELSIGIASTVFSFSTGYFINYYGFFYPMLSAGILMALTFVVAIFLPETFPPEKRDTSRASILEKLGTAAGLFFGSENRGRRWMYILLILTFTLSMLGVFGRSSVEQLYVMDEPFCWTSEKIGYFGSGKSLLQQFIGMGLVKALQGIFSDVSIAMIGCASFFGGNVIEGLASTAVMLYIAPVVSSCALLTIPMCRAMLSKLTRQDQQGAVFSAIAGLEASINLGGSVLASQIYEHTLAIYRGFVFFVFALANFISFFLLLFYKRGIRKTIPVEVR